nr:protein kinase [Gammaproteobacteria bacterium]
MDNLSYKILVSIPGYEILHELGRGGMSTVYLAVQESLQRNLALKVMSSTLSVDPSFKDRFMREGRTLGQLTHPNIVTVYDIGISASRYFIAMEYVGVGLSGTGLRKGFPSTKACASSRTLGVRCTTPIAAASYTATSSLPISCFGKMIRRS